MKISVITPELPESRAGNWITAARYVRIFEGLGHRVDLSTRYDGSQCDAMVALHARRSYASIRRFHEESPDKPLIVVLTGTDLYRDIRTNADAQASLAMASRLVVLQRMGVPELSQEYRGKTRVIYQSVSGCNGGAERPPSRFFKVAVVGHLRGEKDSLRTAMASRLLPPESRARVVHVGAALDPELGRQVEEESRSNRRYRWLGPIPHWRV